MPDLVIALGQSDEKVQESAIRALTAIGSPATASLVEALDSENERTRNAAETALTRLGVDSLIKALPDHPRVRHLLVQKGESAIESLIRAAGNNPDFIEILREIGKPAEKPLQMALENVSQREIAARALACMGKLPDIQSIEARLAAMEAAKREAIQSAKQRLKLEEFFENSSDPFLKIAGFSFDRHTEVSLDRVQRTLHRIVEQIVEQETHREQKLFTFYQLAYTWLQAIDSEPLLFNVPLGEHLKLTQDMLTYREQLCTLDSGFSDLTTHEQVLVPALLVEHGYEAVQQHLRRRIQFFEKHLEMNPQDEEVSSYLETLRGELKTEEELRQRWAKIFYEHQLTPLRWAFPPAGELYADLILRLDPEFAGTDSSPDSRVESAYFTMGGIYNEAGLLEDAIRLYEKGLAQKPDEVRVLAQMANCYMTQGNWAKARSLFEQALQIQPEYSYARWQLGLGMWLQDDMKTALLHFAMPIQQENIYALALAELIVNTQAMLEQKLMSLCTRGQDSEALRLVSTLDDLLDNAVAREYPRQFVQARKSLVGLYAIVAQARPTREVVDRFVANASKIVELDSSETFVLGVVSCDAARYFLENGDHRTAQQWAEQSVRLAQGYDMGWFVLALCHLELRSYQVAVQCAENAARLGNQMAMDLLRRLQA